MRSRAKHYKHVVVDFDKRCKYSRGEACIDIKNTIDTWIDDHVAYARVNAWFGISTITVIYIKVYPGNTTLTSSVSYDKGGSGIGYLASTTITSAIHLSKVLRHWRDQRRGVLSRVIKEFLENLVDRANNNEILKNEIKAWIDAKRRIRS
jgi:hypothetical protein